MVIKLKNSYTRKCCNHSMFHGAQVNNEVQLTVSDKNPSSKNGIQTGTKHKYNLWNRQSTLQDSGKWVRKIRWRELVQYKKG